jgi:hypothetical protein
MAGGVVVPPNNRLLPSLISINFNGPPVDEDLITHRLRIQKMLLPGFSQLSEGIENAIATMASAIVQQTDEARTARETKQLEEETPKLPSGVEKFKHTIHILQRLLMVDDKNELPLLWHEWANCGKKQELSILRDLLNSYAQGPQRFTIRSPIITPKLVQELTSFTFIGDHRDDVNVGLSPFNVIEGGETFRKHNLELSKVQGTIFQSDIGFTLSDLDTLQKRELKAVPLCYFDLEKSLGLFGNLLAVTLGDNHVLTTAYRHFWELLTSTLRDDIRDPIDIQHSLHPAHLLQSVQFVVHYWLSCRQQNLIPSPPNFTDILERIQMANYQLPGLPGIYHELTYTTKSANTVSTATASSSGTLSSDLSTLSGMTLRGQPLLPTANLANKGRNTFVQSFKPLFLHTCS